MRTIFFSGSSTEARPAFWARWRHLGSSEGKVEFLWGVSPREGRACHTQDLDPRLITHPSSEWWVNGCSCAWVSGHGALLVGWSPSGLCLGVMCPTDFWHLMEVQKLGWPGLQAWMLDWGNFRGWRTLLGSFRTPGRKLNKFPPRTFSEDANFSESPHYLCGFIWWFWSWTVGPSMGKPELLLVTMFGKHLSWFGDLCVYN